MCAVSWMLTSWGGDGGATVRPTARCTRRGVCGKWPYRPHAHGARCTFTNYLGTTFAISTARGLLFLSSKSASDRQTDCEGLGKVSHSSFHPFWTNLRFPPLERCETKLCFAVSFLHGVAPHRYPRLGQGGADSGRQIQGGNRSLQSSTYSILISSL